MKITTLQISYKIWMNRYDKLIPGLILPSYCCLFGTTKRVKPNNATVTSNSMESTLGIRKPETWKLTMIDNIQSCIKVSSRISQEFSTTCGDSVQKLFDLSWSVVIVHVICVYLSNLHRRYSLRRGWCKNNRGQSSVPEIHQSDRSSWSPLEPSEVSKDWRSFQLEILTSISA